MKNSLNIQQKLQTDVATKSPEVTEVTNDEVFVDFNRLYEMENEGELNIKAQDSDVQSQHLDSIKVFFLSV